MNTAHGAQVGDKLKIQCSPGCCDFVNEMGKVIPLDRDTQVSVGNLPVDWGDGYGLGGEDHVMVVVDENHLATAGGALLPLANVPSDAEITVVALPDRAKRAAA